MEASFTVIEVYDILCLLLACLRVNAFMQFLLYFATRICMTILAHILLDLYMYYTCQLIYVDKDIAFLRQ
jgi:hypothetical protein